MSIEHALVAQAHAHLLSAKARATLQAESTKGCLSIISPEPVALEPVFDFINGPRDLSSIVGQDQAISEAPPGAEDLVRLQVWISPEQGLEWTRSELFLKQLVSVSHRVGFEIVGNRSRVIIDLLCHRDDLPVLTAAFLGEFEQAELTPVTEPPLLRVSLNEWGEAVFLDLFPPPPYSHLLTRPDELRLSPLEPLMTAMAGIPEEALGLFQALFQPVPPAHNWHHNVQVLLDLEFALKLMSGLHPMRHPQQAPSGDLRQMAWGVENKAHGDKPFFCLALRVAVLGGGRDGHSTLRSLATFTGVFQHGGRPLRHLTAEDHRGFLGAEQIRAMFLLGLTHRPGFLVNSLELTGPVHIPPASALSRRPIALETLETLPAQSEELSAGTPIGQCVVAGRAQTVCIPTDLRRRHTHLIGRPGMGKSTIMEHMGLSDIETGAGVAVLDPHGDLVERLLCLVPERHTDRVIHFDPGDPEWVPLWNPLSRVPGQDLGRTADDLVGAIRSVVTGWGDRLEHLLRHAFYALLHLRESSLLDVSNLLRNRSEESRRLRREILQIIDSEAARVFWREDFEKYGKDDLGPPKNKLSKLLLTGTVSLMLSQPHSLFNLRQVMDEGLILLVNLSTIGSEVRDILGSFLLSLLHLTALGRSDTPAEQRRPFHIHCDEAHRFVTDALEDLIAETRKFGVSLALAHQHMGQFREHRTDAITSVGTTLIFNVNTRDARLLTRDLRGLVDPERLIDLEIGEAIARIGTEIVHLRTPAPLPIPERHFRDHIIAESRRRFCQPAHEVRRAIRNRGERWHRPFTPLSPLTGEEAAGEGPEEFVYDEW